MSAETGFALSIEMAECVNYASWQNASPLLHSISIENSNDEPFENLRLEAEAHPAALRAKTWFIERIAPRETYKLVECEMQLDAEYLDRLDEAENCNIRFRLFRDDQALAEAGRGLRVLARDEWGGMHSMDELLPAFVTPNDPELARILKSAADVLAKAGHAASLDGYQSGDPGRAYLLTAALWSAIAAEKLTYSMPPASFERNGQKIRRPGTVLQQGLATCLDSTLLFASAIEAVGLNPIIVMLKGHCFAGVWLVNKTGRHLIEEDCTEIRKALASGELTTFETTLITNRPPAPFAVAIKAAADATRESEQHRFVAAIDVARARMAQIRPIASRQSTAAEASADENDGSPLPLPGVPEDVRQSAETATEKPTTPAGRIERWQRKLLDLSLNNRLLNFRQSAKSVVPVLCPDIPELEDRLAAGKKLRIITLDELNAKGLRSADRARQLTREDRNVEFAREALLRNELASPLPANDLTARLTALYRNVRNDLAEGGSNTLYLAIGFLKWKQKPEDDRVLRAPLLLAPVVLTRKSAISPYSLEHHEDDARFNATLIQLLKKDFGRDLTAFEFDLPKDHSGIDVPLVFKRVRDAVRDIPGFEVVNESFLSRFSFAKYLMWKDLVDRVEELTQNRVVRHLIHDPDKPFNLPGGTRLPLGEEIDRRYAPKDMVHPLPADSSQLAAMMAAAEGKDFILIGPPGTGKSQTIANLITQCLANNMTVLFVAEKTAALDVVHRRLRDHGLGDCCVELHSNRTNRRRFLEQLERAWNKSVGRDDEEWTTVNHRLKLHRDELNAYVAELHALHANGWSVYQAIGEVVKGLHQYAPEPDWADAVRHDAKTYESLVQLVDELASTAASLDLRVDLRALRSRKWSVQWEKELLSHCSRLRTAATVWQASLKVFADSIGLQGMSDASFADLQRLVRLAKALPAFAGEDLRLLVHRDFAKLPNALQSLEESLLQYREAVARASATYQAESLERIPVDEMENQWRDAVATIWPISWFAKRKMQRLLQSYAASGMANPVSDLPAIRAMQQRLTSIRGSMLAEFQDYWKGLDTDTVKLRSAIQSAEELRQSILELGQSRNVAPEMLKAVCLLLKNVPRGMPDFAAANALVKAAREFTEALRAAKESHGLSPFDSKSQAIAAATLDVVSTIERHRRQVQNWTAWCDVRHRAISAGLGSFVKALTDGAVAPPELPAKFRLGYARWWLPGAMDRSPKLVAFKRFKHEKMIEEFRSLDSRARELASHQAKRVIAQRLPSSENVSRGSELGLLRHQMALKRPSRSIREMIALMPESFRNLAPCLLMSPLSIAQYLPANHPPFDVVVFDEASQITTWDAVGAIARGRQTIIVGDPKQLPPTNFFEKSDDDANDEEIADFDRDLESILDEGQASGLPLLQLRWHYRSRHESLIAFSNWHYYDNRLVTFPAAESEDRGVEFRHLPEAIYDRGKSRTNRKEAEAIVADAVARMRCFLKLPEKHRLTIGVVTFNVQQQTLIQDLFDQARCNDPSLEWYFSDDRIEPAVVKNLENVQGDERDIMYFSVTFGKDSAGHFTLNFGALNREGGERRLNVAVTRSRQLLLVYSSLKADEIDAERSGQRGVKDLKAFLDYAEKGPRSLPAAIHGSKGEFESYFEEAVASALTAQGWTVHSQVGVSAFRVDLGIVHPDKPGAYLAGIECDGATYHRSASARDRDKTRQLVLENLGWRLIRIWSPDWWHDPEFTAVKVHRQLTTMLDCDRASSSTPAPTAVDGPWEPVASPADVDPTTNAAMSAPDSGQTRVNGIGIAEGGSRAKESSSREPGLIMRQQPMASEAIPSDANSELIPCEPDDFFDASCNETLRAKILSMLEAEAPVREDVLVRMVARAHGIRRATQSVRQRVLALIGDAPFTRESTGRFLWSSAGPAAIVRFRHRGECAENRSADEIALAEWMGLIQANPELLANEDPPVAYARRIGLSRLARSARMRIEEAISEFRKIQHLDSADASEIKANREICDR